MKWASVGYERSGISIVAQENGASAALNFVYVISRAGK
jgi:hypothetical protein